MQHRQVWVSTTTFLSKAKGQSRECVNEVSRGIPKATSHILAWSQTTNSICIKPSNKPGGALPPTAFCANVIQPRLLSCGTYITKINLDFYFQQLSQLVFVSLFIKIRSYLQCAFKCKLKPERKVSRMDTRSLGHTLPRKDRSHPFGTDLCGGVLQSRAMQRA